MMLPPMTRCALDHPAAHCELLLAKIRRRLERLDLAARNPLAWFALELLAAALELEGPAEECRRLWLAEALLEAALSWYELGQVRES